MGQKILVPCFDVYNDRPFPEKYTVKDYIFNTKLELVCFVGDSINNKSILNSCQFTSGWPVVEQNI